MLLDDQSLWGLTSSQRLGKAQSEVQVQIYPEKIYLGGA